MSEDDLQDIILSHNLTLRKRIGFKTSAQAFLKERGVMSKSN